MSDRISVGALVRVFTFLSTTTYGGGQSAAIRREIVRRRGWLTDEELLELRSIALISPGPNSPNLALLVGLRLNGTLGAVASYASASLPSVVILLVLGALALDPHFSILRSALRGCAAAAVGLALANAIETTAIYRGRLPQLAVIAVAALCVIFVHLSLWLTLVIFVPISFAVAQLRRKAT